MLPPRPMNILPWFKLNFSLEDEKENDKFHIIWKINYLSLLAMLIIAIASIAGDIDNTYLFLGASLIPILNLLIMNKTKSCHFALWFICIAGLLFPIYTLCTFHDMIHYGDLLWLLVTVCFAYYGLGLKIGRVFLTATIIILAVYITFFLNDNISQLKPFETSTKLALFFELTLALIIIFTILTLFIKHERKSQKKVEIVNKELEGKNLLMEAQNHEKEILLKEIHHRVKNNLQIISSLLNLQTNEAEDKVIKDTLQEGRERIMTMAMLHQMLYQSEHLDTLDLDGYIKELIENLTLSFGKENFAFEIDVKNIVLDVDTTLSLGLILNELLTNSFKYCTSQNCKITIQCKETTQNHYVLVYYDNGPGLPPEISFENTKTLGLKLVSLLSRQISGSCTYEQINGAQFVINFTNIEERKSLD
jgi:two-component sensor histidine kinase